MTSETVTEYRYELLRDGEIISTFDTYNNAYAELLWIQGHSAHYAMTYAGYEIRETKERIERETA